MELSIGQQAMSLLCFACLGFALGLVYDALRPIRYRCKTQWIWDLLFCAAGAAGCFVFSMGSGRLGVWDLMAALLFFCLYINLFSTLILPGLLRLSDCFCRLISLFTQNIKKFPLFAKKLFTNAQK